MKAITVDESSKMLGWAELPDPVPAPDEVLIAVRAAGVNRADLAQREGRYPPPPGASPLLGLEVAGEILQLGSDVRTWRVGDRVCALLPGGGYASRAAVPHDLLMPIPSGWSMEEAAALPEAHLTAFLNVFIEGAAQKGERLLVHGGASGVGLAAIQLARASGVTVFATAGTDEKLARCVKEGAKLAVNYKKERFGEALARNGIEIDVVLDMVGAPYAEENLRLLATGGRIVYIAFMGGAVASFHLPTLMKKRARVIGSVLRSRSREEKAALTRAFVERFGGALESGEIRPVMDSVVPFGEAHRAHARMASNQNIGKIVLSIEE